MILLYMHFIEACLLMRENFEGDKKQSPYGTIKVNLNRNRNEAAMYIGTRQ